MLESKRVASESKVYINRNMKMLFFNYNVVLMKKERILIIIQKIKLNKRKISIMNKMKINRQNMIIQNRLINRINNKYRMIKLSQIWKIYVKLKKFQINIVGFQMINILTNTYNQNQQKTYQRKKFNNKQQHFN